MTAEHTPSHYIHGTASQEQLRLSTLNAFMNDACLRELSLRGGERILDVGCGLGQLTRSMGRVAGPQGRVVGVERDAAQLAEACRLAGHEGEEYLVDFREGDASTLPLSQEEWGSFDLVHTRFLLEHLGDPLSAVRQMVQAARPGGRVVLEDDDHDVLRLYPEPPGFQSVWDAYMRTYDKMGNDPQIGRRLVALLYQAGATPVRNTWIFFGSCAGHPTWELIVQNAVAILRGARDRVVSLGLLEAVEYDGGVAALPLWGERPDASLWFAICWAEGRRPDAPVRSGG